MTEGGLATVAVGKTQWLAPALARKLDQVYVCIRAEAVILQKATSGPGASRNVLPGVINALTAEGALVRVGLECGFPLVALVTRPVCEELRLREGEAITALPTYLAFI
jgi:molybdate transport system ATP-binding protein